jgi:hypothetical protein
MDLILLAVGFACALLSWVVYVGLFIEWLGDIDDRRDATRRRRRRRRRSIR